VNKKYRFLPNSAKVSKRFPGDYGTGSNFPEKSTGWGRHPGQKMGDFFQFIISS